MDTSNAIQIAIPFTAGFEGFSPTPYPDGQDYAIGYGNHWYEDGTAVGYDDDPIDQPRALELLTYFVTQTANEVAGFIKVPVSDNMLAALTDLGYNWGTGNLQQSKVLQLINGGAANSDIQTQWLQTATTTNGVQSSDLAKRRIAEASLALSDSAAGLGTTALVLAGAFIVLFIYFATKKGK
jgi:GH24 family phage-related lysozyme (muramidase)